MDEWDVRRLKAVQRKGRQERVGIGDVLSKEQKLLNKKDKRLPGLESVKKWLSRYKSAEKIRLFALNRLFYEI